MISNQPLDQSSPQSRVLIRGINDIGTQMTSIDHSIDWFFSSVALFCFFFYFHFNLYLVFFLLFPSSHSLILINLFYFPENDLEVQTGRCGHLQNEREAQGNKTRTQSCKLCFCPNLIYRTNVILFSTKHLFIKSLIIQCRQPATEAVSHCLFVFLTHTNIHTCINRHRKH